MQSCHANAVAICHLPCSLRSQEIEKRIQAAPGDKRWVAALEVSGRLFCLRRKGSGCGWGGVEVKEVK